MKTFLVLACLLLAVTVRCLPNIDNDSFCGGRADGYYCASCLQPVYCNSSVSPPAYELQPCESAYVCEQFTGTIAGCEHYTAATSCNCNSGDSRDFCDPFSDSYVAKCSSTVYDVDDCAEIAKVCRYDHCVDPQSCTGVQDGTYVHDSTYCNVGYLCKNGIPGNEFSCPENKYLSVDGICRAPPAPCAELCSGNCPDYTDCQRH